MRRTNGLRSRATALVATWALLGAPTHASAQHIVSGSVTEEETGVPIATAQVLLLLILDRLPLESAVAQPRIHHQWLPDALFTEKQALSAEARQALTELGHELRDRETVAKVNALRLHSDGELEAVADPRGPGHAGVVYPTAPQRGGDSLAEKREQAPRER